MTMKKTLTITALAAALAACGQADQGSGPSGGKLGVSSTSSAGAETGLSAELSRLRKQVASKDAKASVSMATGTVVDPAFACGLPLGAIAKVKLGAGLRLINSAADARSMAEQLPTGDPARNYLLDAAARHDAAFEAAIAAADDEAAKALVDKAHAPLEQADAVMRARAFYTIAVRGMRAWEVSPPLPALTGRRNDAGAVATYKAYTNAHEVGACVASAFGGMLSKQLTGVVLQDPDSARSAARSMALEILKDSAGDVLASCSSQYAYDATRVWNGVSAEAVAWTVEQPGGQHSALSCTVAGCEVIQAGVVLLGKGAYSGVSYELAFARATGTSSERSSGTSANNGTNQSTSTQNQVGLAN